ncbi:MAG: hypothetical protein ABJA87_02990 [bacterium]
MPSSPTAPVRSTARLVFPPRIFNRLCPSGPDTAERRSDYISDWSRWNHVRAAAALGAALSFVAALLE